MAEEWDMRNVAHTMGFLRWRCMGFRVNKDERIGWKWGGLPPAVGEL